MTELSPIRPPAANCDPAAAADAAAAEAATLLPSVPPLRLAGDTGGSFTDVPGCGPNGSIQLVLQKRLEQARLGYTLEHDLRHEIGELALSADLSLATARRWLARGLTDDPERRHFEHHLVTAIALGLAELDRLHARRAAGAYIRPD